MIFLSGKKVHFIGVGGASMSALIRWAKSYGAEVSGSDGAYSKTLSGLIEDGFDVYVGSDEKRIYDVDIVVYTSAVGDENPELSRARTLKKTVVERHDFLGLLSENFKKVIAVSGTHGKTTTSTLLSHIFHCASDGASAFLGGISKNYDTNLLVSPNPVIVAEADEFDRSFLQLYPEIAVITAMDADHLDIYGDKSHVVEAFKSFASQVSGSLVVKKGLDIVPGDTRAKVLTYSYDDASADFYASSLKVDDCGYFTFDLHYPQGVVRDCTVGIPGWVNVENAVAASAVALIFGLNPQAVRSALATFSGVKRRFDIHLNTPKCSYIDDYAHHPNEISTAVSTMRDIFPHRRLTAVFQPHLYTRTRDFAADFAKALSSVDKLILLDIYPAREEPIEGVTSEIIFDKVTIADKVLLKKEQLMEYLENEPIDALITFGAGNIDRFVEPITEMLRKRV